MAVGKDEALWRDYWRQNRFLPIQFVNWLRDYLEYEKPMPEDVCPTRQKKA